MKAPRSKGVNECVLASACAATGQDYAVASDLFFELHGRTWADSDLSLDTIEFHAWARETWLPFLVRYVTPRLPATAWDAALFNGDRVPGSDRRQVVIIAKGRVRHMMAYVDGVVEDPEFHVTGALEEVMAKHYPEWKVEQVMDVEAE